MSYYSKASPGLNKRVASALNVNAEVIRAEIYGVLERNKVGRGAVYTTFFRTIGKGSGRVITPAGKRPTPHRASAPGDPPARDVGKLMESISVFKQATPNDLSADTGPAPAAYNGIYYYPAVMEYGTRDKRVLPRPFMRPGAAAARKALRQKGFRVT